MSTPATTPRVAQPPLTAPSRSIDPRAIIVGLLFAAIIGLAIWYLARPAPPLVQGEVENTRIDMAARVSGRLTKILSSAARMFLPEHRWFRSTIPS
jgi:HlyD family secretion protein